MNRYGLLQKLKDVSGFAKYSVTLQAEYLYIIYSI